MWEYTCKTAAGLELDIKLLSGKTKLELTNAKAGTEQVNPTQLVSQTDVAEAAGYVPELGVQHILDATTVEIPVIINNQEIHSGFNLWQIGIYARDPDKGEILYFIAQNEEARKIPGQEQPGFIIETEFVIGVGNAAEVIAKVDPAGTLTRNEADKRYAALEHTHEMVDVLGLGAILDVKADVSDVEIIEQRLSDNISSLYKETTQALFNKVDKVEGKGLSTNDLTQSLKSNYDTAYEHSQAVHARTDATKTEKSSINGNVKINGTETIVYTHPPGTNPHGTTKADVGLDNVPNVVTNSQTPTYTVSSTLAALISGETLSVAFGKLAKSVTDLISHIANKSNPHTVTKAQIGLGNVDNTADSAKPISTAQQVALDKKVDKVTGKGLSANDYTTAEKNKLSGIAAGAQVNSITGIKGNAESSYRTGQVNLTPANIGAIPTSQKGGAGGIAELDANGFVPASQLPSYVDDVLEYATKTNFPGSGESGKIYVDMTTNKTWRWSGSAYVEISPSLALGETSSTAYRGDRGKVAYEHSQAVHARTDATKTEKSSINGNVKINGTETVVYTHPSGTNPHGTTKTDIGLGSVPNVATNDQTPTFTVASTLSTLVSGERLTVSFGKVAKAISDLIAHIGNKSNPHAVTKSQVGLGNVPNVATNSQTPTFTEATGDVDIASGETLSTILGKLLNNIKTLRSGLAGKAASSHNHSTANITSGTLSVARGGTGQTTAAGIRNSLGLGNTTGALPVANGGTGQASVAGIKSAFGVTALETSVGNIQSDLDNLISAETIAAAEAAGIILT